MNLIGGEKINTEDDNDSLCPVDKSNDVLR